MGIVSRGFRGRRRDNADATRVPPGQYVTPDFPVLSAGPTPHVDDVIYRDELQERAGDGLEVIFTLTRSQPQGWTGYARRVDRELVREVAPDEFAQIFICGPTPFVESVAENLVEIGHEPTRIKTERFGPTGR